MTPKPNTYYRTRDGRKAYVAAVLPEEIRSTYRLTGYVLNGGHWESVSWTMDCVCNKPNDLYDLVEEWQEPVKQTFWVNIHESYATVHYYVDKTKNRPVKPLDTIRIEYEQGQSEGKWYRENGEV